MAIEAEATKNLILQELVLELLFAEDLLAFLTTADQVWHYLVSWPERQVLVHVVAFCCEGTSNLITETLQLTKAYTVSVFQVSLIKQILC